MTRIPMLERIRALMARAEHPETPGPEAEIALREANKLMTRHAIEQAEVYASQSASERRAPVKESWHWLNAYSEFSAQLRTMLYDIARFNRCRAVVSHGGKYTVTVVGMREDVDWVQTLYTNCYLSFLSAVNPEWDLELGFDENVYRHKIAGFTWIETWRRLCAAKEFEIPVHAYDFGWPKTPLTTPSAMEAYKAAGIPRPPIEGKTSTFVAAYRRHAAKIGDTTRIETHLTSVYRISFAKGFADRIARRLWEMAQDVAAESAGHELVLANVDEAVNAAFYREFPDLHPEERKRKAMIAEAESLESQRKADELRTIQLAAMTPRQRADFLEREERAERRKRDANDRYWKQQDAKIRHIPSGSRAGAGAADRVRLSRSTDLDDHGATPGISARA